MNGLVSVLEIVGGLLPCLSAPDRRISTKDKISWSVLVVVLFAIIQSFPIAGSAVSQKRSLFGYLDSALASNGNSCLGLGLFPLLVSQVISQILVNGKYIIKLSSSFKKGLAFLAALLLSLLIVIGGVYGTVTAGQASIIMVQFMVGQLLIILFDDCMQVGYGITGGLSLLITWSVASTLMWDMFSPSFIKISPAQYVSESALLAPIHVLWTRSDRVRAVLESIWRAGHANIVNIIASVFVGMGTVWFRLHHVDLSIQSVRARSNGGSYPIRLLESSVFPSYLILCLLSSIQIGSVIVQQLTGYNFIATVFSPPQISFRFTSFISLVIYPVFVVGLSVLFSKYWLEFSGNSSKDLSKMFKDQQVTIRGYRNTSVSEVLEKYLSPVSLMSGAVLGFLVVLGDLFGAVGSGVGIAIATLTIMSQIEIFSRDSEILKSMVS